jgi:hypothetical protein
MNKKMEDAKGNLVVQLKQVKLEISELEDALLIRKNTKLKVEGALELIDSFKSEDGEDKKEKKDA